MENKKKILIVDKSYSRKDATSSTTLEKSPQAWSNASSTATSIASSSSIPIKSCDWPTIANSSTTSSSSPIDDSDLEKTEAATLLPADYARGDIVIAPHILPSHDPSAKHGELLSRIGHVCPKIRYSIVVAIYCNLMIVIPIYSSNKRGVPVKPATYQQYAMSTIHESEDGDEHVSKLANNEERLNIVGEWHPQPGAHVILNDVLSVAYESIIKRTTSKLEEKSYALLHSRYQLTCRIGFMELEHQRGFFKNHIASEKGSTSAPAARKLLLTDAEGFTTITSRRPSKQTGRSDTRASGSK